MVITRQKGIVHESTQREKSGATLAVDKSENKESPSVIASLIGRLRRQ